MPRNEWSNKMADEVNLGGVPVADPAEAPMTEAELRDAIFELSSDEATELLNEYAASFYRPAPLQPNNAHEARRRVAELTADPEFARRYLEGSIEAREELRGLHELIANASDVSDDTLLEPDVALGPGLDGDGPTLSRRDMLSAADGLRRDGFSDAAIEHILSDGKFTAQDVYVAQFWLPRMERDPNLLYPDLPADREYQLRVFRTINAIGYE
jgi:hypothetical protein